MPRWVVDEGPSVSSEEQYFFLPKCKGGILPRKRKLLLVAFVTTQFLKDYMMTSLIFVVEVIWPFLR